MPFIGLLYVYSCCTCNFILCLVLNHVL